MTGHVALLRGVNVGGANKVPMAELRALCGSLGWKNVETYIQSGNVVFDASLKPATLEARLEKAIAGQFGVAIAVIVRSARQWPRYIDANPFPAASEAEPNRVMLCLSKTAPHEDCAAALQERAKAGERVTLAGDGLWIHFPAGAGTSKLSPALLDRLVGSPVTMRNWRTVLKLQDMLRA